MKHTENPEKTPHIYGQLLYSKAAKNTQSGRGSLRNKTATCKKNENGPLSYTVYENELEMD